MLYGKKVIALCTSRVYDAQVNEFIRTLNSLLDHRKYILFIFSINNDMYWEDNNVNAGTSVYSLIDFSVTDVVIIMDEKIKSKPVSGKIAADAKACSVPVIHLDKDGDGDGDGICINFDFEKGFELIVRHVIEEHAVRRVHLIAGFRDNPFSDARVEVFKKVTIENGIPFTDDMVSYGNFWAKPAAEAALKLVENGRLPEAIICANDVMALGVCAALAEKGIRVPEDVIVTGFDGYDEIYFSMPKISSVRCGNDTMAGVVFDTLMGLFEDSGSAENMFEDRRRMKGSLADNMRTGSMPSGRIMVTPELVLNGSCGCPDSEPPADVYGRMNAGFYRYQDDIRRMFNISEVVQMSDSFEKIAEYMKDDLLLDTCCIINRSCLCRENDYFSAESISMGKRFEEERILLYDHNSDTYDLRPIGGSSLAPNLQKLSEREYPVIFTSITYMDKPIGYVCFSYNSCEMPDYSKTFQISTALGIGLGGFIIRQYQRYLNEKVEEMYKNDFLTQLYNRNGFFAAFQDFKEKRAYEGQVVSLFSADLDGLKYINDHFGHDAGDVAIKAVADALRTSCPEGSLCARFGGDEMIALVFGNSPAGEIAAEIEKHLDRFNAEAGLDYTVSASCGYCTAFFDESFDFDYISKLADENMYKIKKNRKDEIT